MISKDRLAAPHKTEGSVLFEPGKSLEGAIPGSLKTGFECVLNIAIVPTISSIPKYVFRYFENEKAKNNGVTPSFELKLNMQNDITLSVGTLEVAIPVAQAARHFQRRTVVNAWAQAKEGVFEIGLSLDNQHLQMARGNAEVPLGIGYGIWGGGGLEFTLKDFMIAKKLLHSTERKKMQKYFEEKV